MQTFLLSCAARVRANRNLSLRLLLLFSLSLGVFLSPLWARQGGTNPQVPQGTSLTFPATGSDAPANSEDWDIIDSGATVIARKTQPAGWGVTFTSPQFTVAAPSAAAIAPNYKVRYKGGRVIDVDETNSPRAAASTVGSSAPVKPFFGVPRAQTAATNRSLTAKQSLPAKRTLSNVAAMGPIAVGGGGSALFDVVTNAGSTAPDAPSNLVATAVSSHRISLTWQDNSTNENGFKLERRTGTGSYAQITQLGAGVTSYIDAGRTASTTYTYRVRAYNQAGHSAYSNEATATTPADPPLAPGSVGREFWLAFPGSILTGGEQGHALQLHITGEADTNGTVTIPGLGFTQAFTVTGTGSASVTVPLAAGLNDEDAVTSLGILVQADEPVSVLVLNYGQFCSEGYLGLPVTALGTDYLVIAFPTQDYYGDGTYGHHTQLSLVASEDDTTVTVTPSVASGNPGSERPAGIPFTLTLDAGQTYQLRSATLHADLTGSRITADKPVAVFGGSQFAFVPDEAYQADNLLVEQLPPTSRWGTAFVSAPLATRTGGDTFRILATADNTAVSINGTPLATVLMRGQCVQQLIVGPASITSDKPILVAQFSNSTSFDGGEDNDPFMTLVPATTQYRASYTFT